MSVDDDNVDAAAARVLEMLRTECGDPELVPILICLMAGHVAALRRTLPNFDIGSILDSFKDHVMHLLEGSPAGADRLSSVQIRTQRPDATG